MVMLRRVPLWAWWIPVVFAVSFPVGVTAVPQWHRVHAIPFTDPADKFADLAVNLALFVPFGYLWTGRRPRRLPLVMAAAAISAGAELTQLFSTTRYPSGTDVVYAMAGALIGAAFKTRAQTLRSSQPSKP